MRDIRTKDLSFKFSADEVAEGIFRGFASTFGPPADRHGDIIDAGAFAKTLAGHREKGTMPALLWQHQHDEPIGVWLSLVETERGLEGVGSLALNTARGAEAYALMKMGALALSIGYGIPPGGQYTGDGANHIKEIELYEVSAVSIPANPDAKVTEIKAALYKSPRDFEAVVREALGLSAREAKRLASGGWRGLVREEQGHDSHELAMIASKIDEISQFLRITK